MLALKKKREAEAKARAEAEAAASSSEGGGAVQSPGSAPSTTSSSTSAAAASSSLSSASNKVSLLGIGGKKTKADGSSLHVQKKRSPGEIRIQKGEYYLLFGQTFISRGEECVHREGGKVDGS